MNSNRKTAIIVGVLFIIATVAGMLSAVFSGPLHDPDYLTKVSANESQIIVGVLLVLIMGAAVASIPFMMFPIFKKHNEALALGYVAFRVLEAVTYFAAAMSWVLLITLSQEFVKAGVPEASHFQSLGDLLLAAREWAFMIGSGLVWSLSALVLNYVLYRTRLIPRWLSGWGLIGATLSFATYLLQFFGISLDILFLPIALQEMAFAVWLIVKGFNPSAIASRSPETDTN